MDAYFAAAEAGNVDAVVSSFASDAVISTGFGDDVSPAVWGLTIAYGAGERTIFTIPSCDVVEGATVSTMTVSCEFELFGAATQAVDAMPISTTTTAVVTPHGISLLAFEYEPPGPLHVGPRFNQWVAENHPEATGFGEWTTVEEARQSGELHAQFALEWAAYLEANNCSHVEDC